MIFDDLGTIHITQFALNMNCSLLKIDIIFARLNLRARFSVTNENHNDQYYK